MAIIINNSPATVDFVLNKPAFKITSNASPVKLVAMFRIQEKVGDTFTILPYIYLDPDSNDSAVFYIDQLLREYFDAIDIDIFSLSTIKKDLYSAHGYTGTFYEWDGVSLGASISSATLKLLYGKLFHQDWPDHDFLGDLGINLNYLNNVGNKIRTWTTAKQYLYWLNHVAGSNNIELRATIYYTDKTTENQTLDTYSSSEQKEVLIIPAGYTELNLVSYAGSKTIYRYDLGLYLTNDTQVGKTISFYLQNKPWWAKQFLFRNNYGVLEALIAEGKESSEIKAGLETSQKRIVYDYAATDFEYTQRVKSRTKEFKVNIGPLTQSEAEHLEEMLNDKLFKIGDTKLIPCNILSKSIKPYDENDDLQVIELKYQYAFEV